jgi:hypothetical protein
MTISVILIGGIVFAVIVGLLVGKMMNEPIERCFELKSLHNDILFGRKLLADLDDRTLFSLSKPLWTVVGMGGMGPRYTPDFSVFSLIQREIEARRESRSKVLVQQPMPKKQTNVPRKGKRGK